MSKKIIFTLTFSTIATMLFVAMPVYAQKDDAMARAQFIIRQLNAEKSALQMEKVSLTKEIETLKADLESLKEKSEKTKKKYVKALDNVKGRNEELRKNLMATKKDLRRSDHESSVLKETAAQYDNDLGQCIDHNQEIHQLTVEMVEEGLWSPAKETEPFTQLKRVKIENLAQDYQYKARDLLIDKNTTSLALPQ